MVSLSVVHHCPRYVAIDKPADLRIDGGRHGEKSDEPNAQALLEGQVSCKVRHCHQLDYATSGVMLYALSKKAAADAAKLFEKRLVSKEYLAILEGELSGNRRIRAPICQDPHDEFKMMCGDRDVVWPHDKKKRKHSGNAETAVYVVSRGTYNSKPITKVRVVPRTGRRHQIRIHCLIIGHPVKGDATYAPVDPDDARMMLHARELEMPFEGGPLRFTTQDPFTPDRLPGLLLDDDHSADFAHERHITEWSHNCEDVTLNSSSSPRNKL